MNKMKKMINIKFTDKLSIYIKTGMKIIRGIIVKFFLKNSKGILFVGKGTTITHRHLISAGKNVKFEDYSEIQGLSKKGLNFGNNVTIGRYTMIRPSSYYGIDIGEGIEIGNNSSIGPMSYIGCSGFVKIGKNVMLGPKVSLFAENHNFDNRNVDIKEQGTNQKGIKIEDNCWIGSNVVILDGVTIGKGSVIGAGTIITKDIPENSKVIDKRTKNISER